MTHPTFGIARKLLAVCLAFGLPIVVMFVLMTKAKLTEIDFASKEIVGDEFQRPLEDALQQVSLHRRSWARLKHGDSSVEAQLGTSARSVLDALDRIDAADRAHGAELQFTPEGLALRNRSEFTAAGLRRRWLELTTHLRQMPVSAATPGEPDGHAAVITHIRTMITHAGDASNLILDPDLDSYYLMDVTLLTLPQMEERLQQIAVDVEELVAARRLTSNDKIHLATVAAFLEQADWDRVKASASTALNEDRNFHGINPALAPAISPYLSLGAEATRSLVERLRHLAGQGSIDGFDVTAFRGDVERLDGVLYEFHRNALAAEDAFLKTRIVAFERGLYWGFSLAATSLLVSSLLAFLLAANVVRRVLRISEAANALAAGDMGARVGHAGSDELGQLAGSFDAMTERIGGLTAEVRRRASELELINANLEGIVTARTQELTNRDAELRLILDNAHDGMLTIDLDGNISSERSRMVERWLGKPRPGVTFADYLAPNDPELAAGLRLGLGEIRADVMPLELTLEQLPRRMDVNGRHLGISYQPILENDSVTRVLVVLSDVTGEIEGRRASALQEEILRVFQACQRDRPGFLDFLLEAHEIVEKISTGRTASDVARLIHTLKGNCALFGVFSVSALCHDVETNMADNDGILLPSDVERLRTAWGALSVTVKQILGDDAAKRLEVDDDEYAKIVDSIANGAPRRDILDAIARWKLEPASKRLNRYAERATSMARRLGKEVHVTVETNDVRLCAETWSPFWGTLVHVIRNALDHGIEPGEERIRSGKHPVGELRLRTGMSAGRVFVEVSDDGRGIAWNEVATKAKAAKLPHALRPDLVAAILTDGISTRDTVTDVSGRGVGMAALQETCAAMEGVVEIESEPSRGTTVRCTFPQKTMAGGAATAVISRVVAPSMAPLA